MKGDVFFTLFALVVVCGRGVVLDCYRTTIYEYDGHQQTTYTGTPCKRWDSVGHNFKDFPDASVTDAGNFCRNPDRSDKLWCITESSSKWGVCGIKKCANNDSTQCGTFTVKHSSKLGENINITFMPYEKDSNAILEWQQRKLKDKRWTTLPFNPKFMQYINDGVYSLVLTNATFQISKDVSYRVHYYNETLHCLMESPKIIFQENEHPEKNKKEDVDLLFNWIIICVCAVASIAMTM